MRPEIKTYAHLEHLVAFALLGALFAFAYPRRIVLVCCVVFFNAIMLEYLQTFTPDRHGTVIDAVDKLIGDAIGISGARGILFLLPRPARLGLHTEVIEIRLRFPLRCKTRSACGKYNRGENCCWTKITFVDQPRRYPVTTIEAVNFGMMLSWTPCVLMMAYLLRRAPLERD